MGKAFILYNPLSNNGQCNEEANLLSSMIEDDSTCCDMTKADTYEILFSSLSDGDYIILCGGDGTLNRFVNLVKDVQISNDILYVPMGSGNDFARDLGYGYCEGPVSIKKYLEELPTVTVDKKTYCFLNGVGFGIDGYCCEEGDKIRSISEEKVDYAKIAVKGLLKYYKPTSAVVTVDGVVHKYAKVLLAPTMYGRFYGGGMMPTPNQDRKAKEKKLSVMVMHDAGKLRTLYMFPSLFKGEHTKYKKNVDVFTGKDIIVEFNRPTALQVDGETIRGVTSYHAQACQ